MEAETKTLGKSRDFIIPEEELEQRDNDVYQRLAWCLKCEKAFNVELREYPAKGKFVWTYAADFARKHSKKTRESVYAQCPTDGCKGNIETFWWWEEYLEVQRSTHAIVAVPPDEYLDYTKQLSTPPIPGTKYPLYPWPLKQRD